MLHILVGLVLFPVKLAFAVFKGLLFGLFAIPLAAVGLSFAIAVVAVVLALGAAALACAVLF
jgi:hypothetical protein